MVTYSTRLLAIASGQCSLNNENLHNKFIDHALEEKGHASICMTDIKMLGFKYQDLPQTIQSSVLFQTQYYWITQVTPAALYGYILVLEAFAAKFGPKIFEVVSQAHGIKTTNFIRVHAEDDIEHIETGLLEISKLSDFEIESATKNLVICAEVYRNMLTKIASLSANKDMTSLAS